MRSRWCLLALASTFVVGACAASFEDNVLTEPFDPGVPTAPSEPPPTGSKWAGIEVEGECGGLTLAWVAVDEVCGSTDDPAYLEAFRAPMFRDGALLGSDMFVVDGSYLWSLDMSDHSAITRHALVSGLGQPLGVASHGGRLLVAAGSEGLLLVDVSDPADPQRLASLELAGPALSLSVDGDTAYVAMGGAGVAVVDVAGAQPTLSGTLSLPGFAAAATVTDGVAYVAACDQLVAIDVTTSATLGSVWLDDAYQGERLVAPAKGVTVTGDVAFVAAGRYGAVAIDVSDPSQMKPLGNCTLAQEPSFYASGLRIEGDTLFVAGGEWGILAVDVSEPLAACAQHETPQLDPPLDGGSCGTEPPWKVLPWQEQWAPPPPGRDPVQVLPVPGMVYAFGDARRIGVRAVDVRETDDPALPKIGRYDEPRLATALVAHGDRVMVLGEAGGLFERDPAALLVPAADPVPLARQALAAAFLDDGRWVLAPNEISLTVEGGGASIPVATTIWPGTLASDGSALLLPHPDGMVTVDPADGSQQLRAIAVQAELPVTVVSHAGQVVLAAPEWTAALTLDDSGEQSLEPHGVFDELEILDSTRWRRAIPRRLLQSTDAGLLEVVSFGGEAGMVLHDAAGDRSDTVVLPPGRYVAASTSAQTAYLLKADRAGYRSDLVTVHVGSGTPLVTSIQSFTGMATAAAVSDDRLYVGDADRGVRVFALAQGYPTPLGIVDLAEVTP
jgi:hypothetical protein